MNSSNLDEVIKSSPIIVHKGRFAYLTSQEKELKNHFLISQDKDEVTIITEEKNLVNTKYEKEVKWFKLFEIKVAVPFLTPGFLAKVTKVIADKKLNILIVSTFSKDYILIREEEFKIAAEALKKAGFPVKLDKYSKLRKL